MPWEVLMFLEPKMATQSIMGGTFWEDSGGVALLKDVSLEVGFKSLKTAISSLLSVLPACSSRCE